MIYAHVNRDDPTTYRLQGDKSKSETYGYRQRFKDVGATWDGRHWIVTDAQRQALGIERMMRATGTHSCGFAEHELMPESKVAIGQSVSVFCGHCDGRGWMVVERIDPAY